MDDEEYDSTKTFVLKVQTKQHGRQDVKEEKQNEL